MNYDIPQGPLSHTQTFDLSLSRNRMLSSFPVLDPTQNTPKMTSSQPTTLFRKQCLAFLSTDTARSFATFYLEFSNRLITSSRKFYKQIRIRFIFFTMTSAKQESRKCFSRYGLFWHNRGRPRLTGRIRSLVPQSGTFTARYHRSIAPCSTDSNSVNFFPSCLTDRRQVPYVPYRTDRLFGTVKQENNVV